MILKISENLIVNINEISQIEGNILVLRCGDKFRLDEISMRNINKICKAFEDKLLKVGGKDES